MTSEVWWCRSEQAAHAFHCCALAVLAGSKYGVRQTRGKFGLGAKMVRRWRSHRRLVALSLSIHVSPPLCGATPVVAGLSLSLSVCLSIVYLCLYLCRVCFCHVCVCRQALIWSRKSTGLPIEIRTAYTGAGSSGPAKEVSYCKLDIDIHKV